MGSVEVSGSEIDFQRGFLLGPWTVLPAQNIIQDNHTREDDGTASKVHLEPKVMEVLVYLARHQGDVIRRDTLIEDVWQTFVSDEVLSRAVSLLRNALNDDTRTPVYVQTVPKSGYRLIHDILPLPPDEANTPARKSAKVKWITASLAIFFLGLLIILSIYGPNKEEGLTSLSDWLVAMDDQHQGGREVTAIAVLPFDNLDTNNENAFYSDGLTDELTILLSKVQGLKVVARRSSYSFRKRMEDVPTIGKLLNVDSILEGSVRREDQHININVQLSNVADGYVQWSESYSRPVNEILDIRNQISSSVVEVLAKTHEVSELKAPEEPSFVPDLTAYQLYLNGRFLWKLRGEQPLRRSIALYTEAIQLDPDFNQARIALASSLVLLPFYSSDTMQQNFSQALAHIKPVKPRDSKEASEIESIKGFIASNLWKWQEAETHFRRAIELSPDNTNTYNWYSEHLSTTGRFQDALTAAEKARELDAVSPVVNDRLGIAYLWLNDDVRAAEQFVLASNLGFSNRINPGYIVFLIRQKRYNEIKSIMEIIHPDSASRPDWLIDKGHLVFRPENKSLALELASQADKEGKFVNPQMQFGLWIQIGGIDQAYDRFYSFVDTDKRKYLQLQYLFTKEAEAFRNDSRFDELLEKAGLEAFWSAQGEPDYRR